MSALTVSQRTIVLLLVALFAALSALTTVSALTHDGGSSVKVEAAGKWVKTPGPTVWRAW